MGEAKVIKLKKGCCKSDPRCKRCPVVCKRLVEQGLAEKRGKRRILIVAGVRKKAIKAARAR